MTPSDSSKPARPGSLSRPRSTPPQGAGGRFVSQREAGAAAETPADEPVAAPASPPSDPLPAPPKPLNIPPSHVGSGPASRGPTATQIETLLADVAKGSHHADAFAAVGIAWGTATTWLKLGEASWKLHSEDGRPLTWQGSLFARLRAADATARSPVLHKLREQAVNEGGPNAMRYLEAKGGGRSSGGGAPTIQRGRDYEEADPVAGQDSMTDEEVLELINGAIGNALLAADLRRPAEAS